ncbi:MAG: hypothetical protein JO121_26040 [Deltaproteobacteria bacterium]|nr:hypothetical protein [Deltaproteobacteria bacterium]
MSKEGTSVSWPFRLRALSFVIGIGVVLSEVAVIAIPLGLALWIAGVAGAMRIVELEVVVGFATALAIIVPAHVRPTTIMPAARNGGSR